MRYKPGLKQSESSQFKFRNISVYAEPKNETLVFPDCHRDETDLMTLKYMVYKGLSMDVKEKFNLYWFKEECLPLPLLNNDDFDNFWEDSFVNEDGCICLWMGMKDTVFGTPKTTPKKKTVSKGTTPRRSPRLNSVDKSVEGASRKLSFMDVPMSKHSQASRSGCSQSKATNEVKRTRRERICIMGTWYNRRTESASWVDGNLVPTAVTLIKKMLEFVTDYGVDPCVAGELYMVTSPKNSVFTVNILAKTCSCLQWQLRGFPCMHAVSALHSIRPQWRKYCSDYYSVENYKATYAPTFAPLDDKSEWVQQ
ncbi:uncharacterized protein LOC113315956 [Papaver somniferum]|uniref:uncharacterized protein LOC113315956 n=1 Tax=Papaver somniferum TaxID=3469 RepID=UPI000E704512|nr:uncharacterized protein LOC113315956 [Papaver somniferum]